MEYLRVKGILGPSAQQVVDYKTYIKVLILSIIFSFPLHVSVFRDYNQVVF
jgi:hypothetical protein